MAQTDCWRTGCQCGGVHRRERPRRTPTPAEQEDTAYRRAYGTNGRAPWGRPLRAAFYTELPEAPTNARTKDDAAAYLGHIRRVLDMECWTPRERDRLKSLEAKWVRRSQGLDARYLHHGIKGGRTNKQDYRAGSGQAVYAACLEDIDASNRSLRNAGPRAKFVQDNAWPLGKPNPDRRA